MTLWKFMRRSAFQETLNKVGTNGLPVAPWGSLHNTGFQPLNKCMKTFANKCIHAKDTTKSNPAKEILI